MHRSKISRMLWDSRWIATPLAAVLMAAGANANDYLASEGELQSVTVQTSGEEIAGESIQPMVDFETLESEQAYNAQVGFHEFAPAASCNCCQTTCCTKEKKEAATKAMKSAFAGVFYANKFDYLNDPCYDGPSFCGDCLKGMSTPLGTLSLGGETRFRYHNERNHRGVGITGRDDNFWLFRQRLYADWKLNDMVRFYAEGLHAESMGEQFNARPIEVNNMDFLNLFVDVNLLSGDAGKLTARLGRQELLYGAQRTVSPLDWANTRRTFEGVRLLYQNDDTSLDGFWTEFVPVDPRDGDEGDNNQQFYGVYGTQKNTALGQLEGYYLGYDNDTANFSFHTIGGRSSGSSDGGILYDFESAYQFGENSNGSDHSAAFVTAGLGRKVNTALWSPTVWLYYDYASGDDDFANAAPGDDGYNHLFPLAHKYNGFMDLFGRRNLHDLNVFSLTPLNDKVSLILWYHYFALAEATTPYSVVMTPYNTTSPAGDRELGHEIDVLFNINLNPRNNILVGYSHFSAGDYYDTTMGLPAGVADDADADFFYAQFQTRY
ncbi:alginate export family protein [Crateriforma conspicua]|uniref:Alginate export domain-containing protein n=2 Tax=Crateriforma conspicua TaxID=2527996 RepID=A0A5C5Y8J6_9PLAN|nr:alginate export family protein [Crateriforma conspicua]QDV65188.1 hypothetical protein Mal65_43580 [Crateriforma conspicua]TWT70585.1 hypothetical protein Pan14r_28920 [Crateriforma conspicua]